MLPIEPEKPQQYKLHEFSFGTGDGFKAQIIYDSPELMRAFAEIRAKQSQPSFLEWPNDGISAFGYELLKGPCFVSEVAGFIPRTNLTPEQVALMDAIFTTLQVGGQDRHGTYYTCGRDPHLGEGSVFTPARLDPGVASPQRDVSSHMEEFRPTREQRLLLKAFIKGMQKGQVETWKQLDLTPQYAIERHDRRIESIVNRETLEFGPPVVQFFSGGKEREQMGIRFPGV